MNETQNELLSRIEAAFDKVARPVYTTKRVARGLDDNWKLTDKEWKALYAQDNECHWWELADRDLIHFQDIFAFLHPDGVLFYGVAYMAHAVRTGDTGYCDSFIHSVCRNSLPDITEEQQGCILDFLEFYRLKASGLEDDIVGYAVAVLNSRQPEIPFDKFLTKHCETMIAKAKQMMAMRHLGKNGDNCDRGS